MEHFVKSISANRARFLNGGINAIPYQLERFNKIAPGIIRGDFNCITANASVGKTTLTKVLYVFDVISYAIEHKLDVLIVYFALEEARHQFESTLMAWLMRKLYNKRYNIIDFDHFSGAMPEEDFQQVVDLTPMFDQYMSYIHLVDDVYNTFGLYKEVRSIARQRGTFYMGDVALTAERLVKNDTWNSYIAHNPEETVIVVTDHVSEQHPEEKEQTLANAMMAWGQKQRHIICKKLMYNCTAVQQQMGEQESLEHFKAGKMKPSMQGLGDNKKLGRLYLNIYGLFSPIKHDMSEYKGYGTNDYFRMANVIKQRYGNVNVEVPLFFDGKTGYIRTMPELKDTTNLKAAYALQKKYQDDAYK